MAHPNTIITLWNFTTKHYCIVLQRDSQLLSELYVNVYSNPATQEPEHIYRQTILIHLGNHPSLDIYIYVKFLHSLLLPYINYTDETFDAFHLAESMERLFQQKQSQSNNRYLHLKSNCIFKEKEYLTDYDGGYDADDECNELRKHQTKRRTLKKRHAYDEDMDTTSPLSF
jgi:hypothetical protein